MRFQFLDACYDISSISTCVLFDEKDRIPNYLTESKMKVTNNLELVSQYECLSSDHISENDYEVHTFSLGFYRDGNLVDGYSYQVKIDKKMLGDLSNSEIPLNEKIKILNNLKPGFIKKFSAPNIVSKLTYDEIVAVFDKCGELKAKVEGLMEENNKKR